MFAYRGDKLLCFYTNVTFENIGVCVFFRAFSLRERGLRLRCQQGPKCQGPKCPNPPSFESMPVLLCRPQSLSSWKHDMSKWRVVVKHGSDLKIKISTRLHKKALPSIRYTSDSLIIDSSLDCYYFIAGGFWLCIKELFMKPNLLNVLAMLFYQIIFFLSIWNWKCLD